MGNCRLRPLPSYDRRGALKPLPQEPEHAADAGCLQHDPWLRLAGLLAPSMVGQSMVFEPIRGVRVTATESRR
jgi:hypothetical protein